MIKRLIYDEKGTLMCSDVEFNSWKLKSAQKLLTVSSCIYVQHRL